MADRSVLIRLGLDVARYVQGADKAISKTKELASQGESSFKKNRDALDGVANAAGALGLAAAAGVGMAVKTFSDFDSQMSAVAATGDDARSNMQALRDAAIDMGASTAFSATEAAQGVENLLKAGVSAEDVLGGGLKGALDLAAAGGLGVGEAAEYAATAMTQFKLEGTDVPHIADLLAAGAGKAQGEVSDMGAALAQSGLVANSFGLSIEETVGGLSAFASAGLIGSDAGTSFKTMLQSIANPALQTKQQMDALGLTFYDANGEFIGLEATGEQLQQRLGGLTDEARQQALAQIFGSDAVRAANVLFDAQSEASKAAGTSISDWTANVNDAGYASETAATRLDNLKGDIEAFGGALESAFIGAGEGANGPLREMVQTATDLVNKFNEAPPALQQGSLLVAGVGAAALLGFAGVTKLVGGVVDLRDDLNTLAPVGSRARGVIGSVGKAAGVAAVAFAGLQVAGAALDHFRDPETIAGVESATSALMRVASGAESTSVALTDLFTRTEGGKVKPLAGDVTDLNSAFDTLNRAEGGFYGFMFGLDEMGSKLIGTESDLSQIRGQFDLLDQSLVGMDFQQAADGFAQIAAQADEQGVQVDELVALFPQYKAQLEAQANQLGINNLTNSEYVAWMGGSIPPAVAKAGEAARAADQDTEGLAAALDEATVSAEVAEAQYYDTAKALLQASGTAIGMESAIDDATAAVEENGRELDINTEAGRANRSALDNVASSALSYRESLIEANASTKDITRATERGRDEFIRIATEMGMTKKEAERLAEQYGLVPEKIQTDVSTPGIGKARDEVRGLDSDINNVNDKSVKVSVKYDVNSDGSVSINGGPRFTMAAGGRFHDHVRGPGTDTSDSIWGLLSNDEFVVKAKSARALGYDNLEKANKTGEWPAFATGGRVVRDLDVLLRTSEAPEVDTAVDRFSRRVAQRVGQALEKEMPKSIGGPDGAPMGSNSVTGLRGHRFTENFANRLRMVERAWGRLNITQGGFRPTTSYSGTSHAGDAVDIARPYNSRMISLLRAQGIAAWDRAGRGNWIDHVHGVPLPYAGKAGGSAIWQAQDYLRGGDGLANGGLLYGPAGVDNLLMRGTSGEYVVNPVDTARHLPLLHQINSGRLTPARHYSTPAGGSAGQHIDMDAINTAVREGTRQGIAEGLRALTPRDETLLVRRGSSMAQTR